MRFAEETAAIRIPEKRKKAGLCYAATGEGLELPVMDLGHSSFLEEWSPAELSLKMDEAVRDIEARHASPPLVRKLLLRLLLRGSLLAKAVGGASGGYASGMGTYLLKLGPGNLGQGYAKRIDRAIASSLPCLSARLRLRDASELLAEALRAPLAAFPGVELRLVSIAGGPAMDCLNALLLLRRGGTGVLEGRRIRIAVLDRDSEGPAFGARALAALKGEGAPLSGLDVELESRLYDWDEPGALPDALGPEASDGTILALSSEGGLFEYAADEAVSANLLAARALAPGAVAFVGTMSVAEGKARRVNEASGAALRFRSLEGLSALAAEAGWRLGAVRECPLSRVFALAPRAGRAEP